MILSNIIIVAFLDLFYLGGHMPVTNKSENAI